MLETTRIKRGYGLRPIRNERELKALIKFCKRALNEKHMYLNASYTKHDWVWFTTIKLYEDDESPTSLRLLAHRYNTVPFILDVWDFIENYSDWYWD